MCKVWNQAGKAAAGASVCDLDVEQTEQTDGCLLPAQGGGATRWGGGIHDKI